LRKDFSEEIKDAIVFISKTLTHFQQTNDYSEMLDDISLTIHSFIPNSKKAVFYNIPSKKEYVINLNIDFTTYYSDSFNFCNIIYFIVGSENNEPCIVYVLDKKTFGLIRKVTLLTVKIAHSVIDNGQCIYSIGRWNLE
jgi:hypothetical protein